MVEVISMGWTNYFTVVGKHIFGIQTGQKLFPGSGAQNFGKVDDNLFRSSEVEAREFGYLKNKLKVKTIVDLTDDEDTEEYEFREEAAKALGVSYLHVPLSDKKYPTNQELETLKNIAGNESNYPIHVFCEGGRHRTSLFSSIYRVLKYNWTGEQCYKESKAYDFYTQFGHKPIKDAIFDFAEKNKK